MPFKSDAQRRYLYAKHPEIARRWSEHEKAMAKDSEKKKKASIDPAVLMNAGLGLGGTLGGVSVSPLAQASLVGASGALSAGPGEDSLLHGVSTAAGSGAGQLLAQAIQSAAEGGALGDHFKGLAGKPVPSAILRGALSSGGILLGREIAKHHSPANAAGQQAALEKFGMDKTSFNWGGLARGAGKALSWGSKALGTLPTGWGNALSAGMGALSGGMTAAAEGHGLGGILAHSLVGTSAALPGGVGWALSAGLNKISPPKPPPPAPNVGQMIGG